jgi:hypothetical protein
MIYFENFEFKKKKISNYVRDLLKSFPNKFFIFELKKNLSSEMISFRCE